MKKAMRFLLGNWEVFLLGGMLTALTYYFNASNKFATSMDLVLCSLGFWLVALAPAFFLKRRARLIWLFVMAISASLLLVSNQIYYRYYQDFITITSMLLLGQVYGVRDSILALAAPSDLYFVLPVLLVGGIALCFRFAPHSTPSTCRSRMGAALLVLCLGVGIFASRYVPLSATWGDGVHWNGSHLYVRQVGLFTFHLFDVQRFLAHKLSKTPVSPEAVERIQASFAQRTRPSNAMTGVGHGKNLIVVQLESIESFPIGMKIGGQEVTPFLNRMAKESLYFPNIYYQVARGNTSDAEFMLNNSLYPLHDSSVNWLYPENYYQTLPRLLKPHGYTSVAFHAYSKIFWNRAFMYPSMGFEAFYSDADYRLDEVVNIGLSDASFYRQSLDFLKQYPEPFFAQMVSLTSHHPYRISLEHQELELSEALPEEFRDYLHAVHYADKAIGVLLEELKERELDDRTVLVVYGDHEGTSLKHFKEIGQLREDMPAVDEFARVNLQTIPLLIRVPNSPVNGVFEHVGGQIDILPTVANLMGVSDEGLFMGDDLLVPKQGPTPLAARFSLGSFVDDETLFVASREGVFLRGRYYDRRTGEKLATELAEEKYRRVLADYDLSQNLIKNNLVKQVHEAVVLQKEKAASAGS